MDFKDSKYLVEIFDFNVLHMQLNTSLFVLALVFIVMFFLNTWLFKPVLRTMDRRRAHLDELNAAAEQHHGEIADLTREYETKLERVRAEVAQVRQEARKETQQAVEEILYKARQEADAHLRQALEALQGEIGQAREQLADAAGDLAEKAANRIVAA